ncbi:hypothetical protein ACHAQJ_005517 [Trichoderma viride]
MAHSPKFHARAGSRASLVSVGQMPVIEEDSNIITIPTSSPTTPEPIMLRVPAKNPRRSLGPPTEGTVMPYLIGFQDMPPGTMDPTEPKDEGDDGDEETVVGQMTPPPPTRRLRNGRWDGEGWRPNDLQRRCHLVLIVAGLLVVLVGLAIGLALGLTKSHVSNQDVFFSDLPTGAFSFDTTLYDSSSSCTSRPSTWRCLSSKQGPPARFYWNITEVNSVYQVSSTNDPIASSIANIPLTILDGGREDERFVFSFRFNATVEPPITTTNRAAKCTYTDTTYQATLWTKRDIQQPYNATQKKRSGYVNWPGRVEIVEIKNATLGVPDCVDSEGAKVVDVRGVMGTCGCVYRTERWI